MTYSFRPAATFTDRHGLFVALVGSTNSGKTFSALRLARGIAGPSGKIAVADTEAGRTLHLKRDFAFDVLMLDPPHRPAKYAEVARAAEDAGYDVLVIDSFSAEWAGVGGVLEWRDEEAKRMAGGDEKKLERMRGAAWIKPKTEHKLMVQSFLGRRIPIIFSIRGEESFKPPNEKFFKAICNQSFLFEVTVSFRLASDRKGIIDLSDEKTFKMEGAHRAIFRDGEQLGETHGAALAAWARGGAAPTAPIAAAAPSSNGATDWRAWAADAGTKIRSAESVSDLAVWHAANREKLEAFKVAAPKSGTALQGLFNARRRELDPPDEDPTSGPGASPPAPAG
jgi:hypothetical protein